MFSLLTCAPVPVTGNEQPSTTAQVITQNDIDLAIVLERLFVSHLNKDEVMIEMTAQREKANETSVFAWLHRAVYVLLIVVFAISALTLGASVAISASPELDVSRWLMISGFGVFGSSFFLLLLGLPVFSDANVYHWESIRIESYQPLPGFIQNTANIVQPELPKAVFFVQRLASQSAGLKDDVSLYLAVQLDASHLVYLAKWLES